jgi:UDP-glucuronate decarboxylase
MSTMKPVVTADLDHILQHVDLSALCGERVFITGGTGFFGCWLLESLLHANRKLNLNVQATVLTRSPEAFAKKAPWLANDAAITLLAGDVKSYTFPTEQHGLIIHAATDSGGQQAASTPAELHAAIVEGTRHTLQFATATGARRLLYTSSGAIYGPQPADVTHITEDHSGRAAADNVYGAAKAESEELCLAQQGISTSIARCFAFLGPHLPLDAHFAIGNFIHDAMVGTPLHIKGDGTPQRSYLYAADLMIWLWTLLLQAPAGGIYNVGSEDAVSIAELAHVTTDTLRPGLRVQIDHAAVPGAAVAQYVPSTRKAREELELKTLVPLDEAIRRTAMWHGFTR